MSRVSITRRLEIDVGHRLMRHEGKCRNYHGHRYVFEVTVQGPALDDVGRVVDFSVIKDVFGAWLDKYWDHGMLLERDDPMVATLAEMAREASHGNEIETTSIGGIVYQPWPKLYVVDMPPTAENMAYLAYVKAQTCLPHPLIVTRMRVHETPNCYADYPAGDYR